MAEHLNPSTEARLITIRENMQDLLAKVDAVLAEPVPFEGADD